MAKRKRRKSQAAANAPGRRASAEKSADTRQSSDTSPSGALRWLASAGILVLALGLYWPVSDHGAVSFDDPAYVTENSQVLAGLTAEGVAWAFTESHSNNWHPITWLTHMADVEFFADDLGLHHLTSVVLHGAAAVLLFWWLGLAAGRWGLAVFVSLCFVVHPLNVESVAWLSERKSTLSAAFLFATLVLWTLRARAASEGRPVRSLRSGRGYYLAALVTAAAGLMSKPMLVTLPFVLLLVDLWPLGRWRLWPGPMIGGEMRGEAAGGLPGLGGGVSWQRLIAEKIPFFFLTAASIGLTLWAQRDVVQSVDTFPVAERVSNALASYFRYPLALVAPRDLAVFYPFAPPELPAATLLGAGVLLLTGVAYRFRSRYPALLFGWLWYVGLLVPVIGIVQVGLQSHADRYAYLPMVGLLVAALWWVRPVPGSTAQKGVILLAATVLAAMCIQSRGQIETWKDDVALYGNAARVVDDSFWANYNLGLVHMRGGDAELAESAFLEARRIEPQNVETLLNLGHLAKQRGAMEASLPFFAEAVALRPSDLTAAGDLAQALFESEKYADAEGVAREIVGDFPDDPRAWVLLGTSRVRLGQMVPAEDALRRAVELDGEDPISQNALGVSLAQRQRFAEAVPFFRRAVELDPGYAEAAANLQAARDLASR